MAWAAFSCSLAGALLVYLAARHQAWLAQPLPPAARWAGCGMLAVALLLWWQALRPLAAVFTHVALLMLLFTTLPGLGALRRAWRSAPSGARHG